jgi:hypothetical protein
MSLSLFLPVICIFITAGLMKSSEYDAYSLPGDCHIGRVIEYSLLVYTIVYGLLVGVGLYFIRHDDEFFGFRRNIGWLLVFGSFLFLLVVILMAVLAQLPQEEDNLALLILFIPGFYQLFAILLPAIQTFSFLECSLKAIDATLVEPLSEVVVTKNGFAWFYLFTLREFSQENPLCWKAIQTFKTKTSYNALKDIYSKFFAPFAPLAVNLSDRSKRILTAAIEKTNENTPVEVLQSIYDGVQLEVMDLMEGDSYRRFVNSPFYQRYKQNDPAPKGDEESTKDSSESSHTREQAPSIELGRLVSDETKTTFPNAASTSSFAGLVTDDDGKSPTFPTPVSRGTRELGVEDELSLSRQTGAGSDAGGGGRGSVTLPKSESVSSSGKPLLPKTRETIDSPSWNSHSLTVVPARLNSMNELELSPSLVSSPTEQPSPVKQDEMTEFNSNPLQNARTSSLMS